MVRDDLCSIRDKKNLCTTREDNFYAIREDKLYTTEANPYTIYTREDNLYTIHTREDNLFTTREDNICTAAFAM